MSVGQPRVVLFVCRHGAAKSVLAADGLRRLAAERGISVVGQAAGIEPDQQISPAVSRVLGEGGADVSGWTPRSATESELMSAWRVITFNLEPADLPAVARPIDRWDDIPAASQDLHAARAAIGRHLERLVEDLEKPDA